MDYRESGSLDEDEQGMMIRAEVEESFMAAD